MDSDQERAAFISWDGPGQNYLESLFLPIFERVADDGIEFSVLQFRWGEDLRRESTAEAARQLGIGYEACRVIRRPLRPATLAMIVVGAARIVAHVRRQRSRVLIPRSVIPAAMTLLARRHLPDVRIVYDSDGMMADERVEFGGWSGRGMNYRVFRGVEAAICRVADSVMTRSGRGAELLKERVGSELDERDLYVVPNGKESSLFCPGTPADRRQVRRELGVAAHTPLLVYAGSLGERYKPEEIFRFFSVVRRRRADSHLAMLTGHGDVACQIARKMDIPPYSLTIQRVEPDEVPRYLAAADLGISFREATLSQQCVSPIKVAEYLLCGVPVIATTGIGDMDRQLSDEEGIFLPHIDARQLSRGADEFVHRILPEREAYRRRCRRTGLRHFTVENAARGYRDAICAVREHSSMSVAHGVGDAMSVVRRSVIPSSTIL